MGLRSAVLTSGAAYWASWADSLHMIEQRHPAVANQILHELTHHQEAGFHVAAASIAREELIQVGFTAPGPQVEDHQIGMPGDGWQQAATDAVHTHLVETSVRPRLSATEQAMLRSQGGPLSGVPYSCFPTSALPRFDASQFRVLMLRRLWLPLPPSSRNCRCGRLLDVLGHHRAACAEAGVLGRRGFALESQNLPAGARVGTNLTPGGWRWSLTACPSSTALSWRLTPQWCLQSGGMDFHDHGVSAPTEQHWQQPDA